MIDTDKYEGHNTDDRIWHQYSEGITSDYTDGKSRADTADAQLIADAPKLLAEVKRLTKTLELIAKEMPFDYWLHTLINDVIGYEKWQAKEMIE